MANKSDSKEVCLCNSGSPDGRCPIHGEIYKRRYSGFAAPSEPKVTDVAPKRPRSFVIQEVHPEWRYMAASEAELYMDWLEAELARVRAEGDSMYAEGFNRCKDLAMMIVDEHYGFVQRIESLDPITSKLPTPPKDTSNGE